MTDRADVLQIPNDGWDPRVRVFRYGDIVDSFAVVSERFLVLVDTLVSRMAMEEVLDILAADGIPRPGQALLVVNTHGDWDHVWGNGLFAGPDASVPAPIVAHADAPARMMTERAEELLVDHVSDDPEAYATASWVTPTFLFRSMMVIDGGDLTMNLLPTPGHTPDHISVWIPEIGLVLPGDAAEAPLPLVSRGADVPILRHSLAALAALDAHTALYCHAPGISSPMVIDANLNYFAELEARCRAAPHLEGSDGAASLHWPLEDAVPVELLPSGEAQLTFYRRGHNGAIRAMIEWFAGENS